MKWVSVNSNSTNENFELWKQDQKLATVSFSTKTHIVRLVSNLGKRLFFFEKRGLLNPRTVIANEYGIQIGKFELDMYTPQKGVVELDGRKYCFQKNPNNAAELSVYDEEMQNNLIDCSFNMVTNGLSKTKTLLDSKFPSLLLLVCWYALVPHHSPYSEVAA